MYPLVFVAFAGGSFGLALVASPLWLDVLLGWATASFLLVAFVYAVNQPRWFLKRRGRVSLLGWPLYWAYFAGNAMLVRMQVSIARKAPAHEIVPGLWLGRRLRPREADRFEPAPAAVIDLTSEFTEAPAFRSVGMYACIPVLDNTPPTPGQLRDGAQRIAELLRDGPVYVHCALGHGRSAMVVAAYLMLAGQAASADEAWAAVRQRRPSVRLTPAQRRSLRAAQNDLVRGAIRD